MTYRIIRALAVLPFTTLLAFRMLTQVQTDLPPVIPNAQPVAVEQIKVHGVSLEGNPENDALERDVLVFLPPSYGREMKRRYPVVYALHGYSIGAEQWNREIHVPQTVEGAFAQGAKKMIVVLPDSKTLYNGSTYSSSPTTGDFERFISRDLVGYIDAHHRTMPTRLSRGLASPDLLPRSWLRLLEKNATLTAKRPCRILGIHLKRALLRLA